MSSAGGMKRIFYITAFAVLGLLLATLVHAAIEIPILSLITGDFARYQESFIWRYWPIIHGVSGAVLWGAGALGGVIAGRRFWQILYVEKRYGTPRF